MPLTVHVQYGIIPCNQQRALAIMLQPTAAKDQKALTTKACLNTLMLASSYHPPIFSTGTFCHVTGNLIFTASWIAHFHITFCSRLEILVKFNIHNFLRNQHIIDSKKLEIWLGCLGHLVHMLVPIMFKAGISAAVIAVVGHGANTEADSCQIGTVSRCPLVGRSACYCFRSF